MKIKIKTVKPSSVALPVLDLTDQPQPIDYRPRKIIVLADKAEAQRTASAVLRNIGVPFTTQIADHKPNPQPVKTQKDDWKLKIEVAGMEAQLHNPVVLSQLFNKKTASVR
jgi:hypothetical protein